MMWRTSSTMAIFLNDVVRNRSLELSTVQNGMKAFEPRWKECVAITAKYMPIAAGALYVKKFFDEDSKQAATEMVNIIRHEFEANLKTVSWMDEKTRAAALFKVKKMQNHIGYPNELIDDKMLIESHKGLVIHKREYLKSVLNLNHFRLTTETKKFREIINKTHWEKHSDVAIADAYYSWNENSIRKNGQWECSCDVLQF